MRRSIDETDRRRAKQVAHNLAHGITPRGVEKRIADLMRYGYDDGSSKVLKAAEKKGAYAGKLTPELLGKKIAKLEKEMRAAAQNLEFEKAAKLRDEVRVLRQQLLVDAA